MLVEKLNNLKPSVMASPTAQRGQAGASSFGALFQQTQNGPEQVHKSAPKGAKPPAPGRTPLWYGQYGAMTRFVPSQYIDPNYHLPTLPSRPVADSKHGLYNPMGRSSASLTREQVKSADAQYETDQKAYTAAMAGIRGGLDANFDALPSDVKSAAFAARDAWLAENNKTSWLE